MNKSTRKITVAISVVISFIILILYLPIATRFSLEERLFTSTQTLLNSYESVSNRSNATEHAWCQRELNSVSNIKHNHSSFASQWGQDWFLYSSMFINMQQRGMYVDLAANQYKKNSNTYFFDKCLSWNGLCIEAEPALIPQLISKRSCDVIPQCIWSKPMHLTFISRNGTSGMAGLKGYNKIGDRGTEIPMTCVTLSDVFRQKQIDHVDFLSLDIEGSELQALEGINFNTTKIDVIIIETSDKTKLTLTTFLESNGYIKKHMIRHDIIFVHKTANKKLKWIDDWMAQ
eukprot:395514_1